MITYSIKQTRQQKEGEGGRGGGVTEFEKGD